MLPTHGVKNAQTATWISSLNQMNDIQIIQQKIHEIRGQRVILDFDLAELYQVTTGNLNKAVKRNIRRFPPDFMFQLTKDEFEEVKANLIFHFGISRWGGTRKLPHAFTEQGVAMLSGILNSTIAIDMNIAIMRPRPSSECLFCAVCAWF